MTRLSHFTIGCAVGAVLLLVGQQLGQADFMTRGAAAMVLLSGGLVAVANTPRSRGGRAAAKAAVLLYFSFLFFDLGHRLKVSSFDPKPSYGVVALLLSLGMGGLAYRTAAPADPSR